MSLIYQLIGYLNNTSGTCTVQGASSTYNGTASISVSNNVITLTCNFTPTQNDNINSVTFSFSTCLGALQQTSSLNSAPVIANYAHVATTVIKVAQI